MTTALRWILETFGFGEGMTEIHNASDVPILLIPYEKLYIDNSQGPFPICKDLAENIEAGKHKYVKGRKYDLSPENNGRQIYILFRVRKTGKLKDDYPNGDVTPAPGERIYMHTYLPRKGKLSLRHNKEGQVIELDYDAGQTASGVVTLQKAVEELTKLVETLSERVAKLENP